MKTVKIELLRSSIVFRFFYYGLRP